MSSESIPVQQCKISKIDVNFLVSDLQNSQWSVAMDVEVSSLWFGERAPVGRTFSAVLLWSETSLYARFDAKQAEQPLIANDPQLESKTIGLWDRDVCEIFIAPHKYEPRKYFEFEIAPTGEWLDLAIDSTSGERVTDWDYASGMETAARIEENRVVMAMKIPWDAFGMKPKAGDVWLGNIFRCVGKEPDRGYLAWRPTKTEKPNFHVPEKFGEFVFL